MPAFEKADADEDGLEDADGIGVLAAVRSKPMAPPSSMATPTCSTDSPARAPMVRGQSSRSPPQTTKRAVLAMLRIWSFRIPAAGPSVPTLSVYPVIPKNCAAIADIENRLGLQLRLKQDSLLVARNCASAVRADAAGGMVGWT